MGSNNIIRGNNNTSLGSNNHIVGNDNSITASDVFGQNINNVTVYSGSNINLFNVTDTIVAGTNITAIGVTSGGTLTGNNMTYVTNLVVVSSITYSDGVMVTGATNDFTPYGGIITPEISGDSLSNLRIGQFSETLGTNLTGTTIINSENTGYGVYNSVFSSMIGGRRNRISAANPYLVYSSTILGGTDNSIVALSSNFNNIAIIACTGVTATTNNSVNNSVYVPNICVTKGISIYSAGTEATAGSVQLIAGSATINTTKVTAASLILLTAQDNNSIGVLRVNNRNVGTDFTIVSSNGADNGLVAWMIVEPF